MDAPPATVATAGTALPVELDTATAFVAPAVPVAQLGAALPVELATGVGLDAPAAAIPELGAALPLLLGVEATLRDQTKDVTVLATLAPQRRIVATLPARPDRARLGGSRIRAELGAQR